MDHMLALEYIKTNPEVGEQVQARDLKTKTVYILYKPATSLAAVTCWCMLNEHNDVVFEAKKIGVVLLLQIDEQGHLRDSTGERVYAFEYLGVV